MGIIMSEDKARKKKEDACIKFKSSEN